MIFRCSLDVRTRPLLSRVAGTFSMGGDGAREDESELLVDVIALINTIFMRTLSRGAWRDAYTEMAQLYLQRWRMELTFRDLKTVMQMEVLRCKTPEMVHKEILMHFIAHNLVRLLMQEAALVWSVPLQRITFKGTLDTLREYLSAAGCRCQRHHLRRLYTQLLAAIASGQVPHRPGRREPRAVKRRPKNHQWLTAPRHRFKEYRHRGKYPKRRWS
jgi:Transposase DDE domain